MNPYLIAFDLDGTILPGLYDLPEENAAALRVAAEAGHYPVIATGRTYCMCSWVYERIGLTTPICAINGAHLLFPDDGSPGGFRSEEVLLDGKIAASVLHKVAPLADKFSNIYAEHNDTLYYLNPPDEPYFIKRFENGDGAPLDMGIDSIPCSRLVFQLRDEDIADELGVILNAAGGNSLAAHIRPERIEMVEGAKPGMHRLQLFNEKTDKWYGVCRIADSLGIPRERIVSFGDHWNDQMMLEEASLSYALRGSTAVEYAKRETRLTCEECGFADVLYELIKRG